MVKALIPYAGGKYRECKWLYQEFPDKNIYERYIEVFGGGGVVFLNKERHKEKSEVINDRNNNLMTLMEVVRDSPAELEEWLEHIPYSRHLNKKYTEELLNNPEELEDLERAGKTFYVYLSSFGGKMDAAFGKPSITRNNQTTYYNKIDEIKKFSERLKGTIIESIDYKELLKKYDHKNVFFYFDPPYRNSEEMCNGGDFSHDEFYQELQKLEGKWAVSYDHIPDWADNYNIVTTEGQTSFNIQNESQSKRLEVLIKNY